LLLAEHAEGLQLLCDDPLMLKPPLTDVFRNRLWLEIVRPGRPEASERALLEAGLRLGCKPVASLHAYLGTPSDHATFRLLAAIRQGVPLDQLPACLCCHRITWPGARRSWSDSAICPMPSATPSPWPSAAAPT
jgi:hypothetical protein